MKRSPMPPRATPMARGKGLAPGKPLARTGSLTTVTPLQRQARISPVSKKRAKENRLRAKVIAATWPERPRCDCGCGRWADDVHEILSRARGGSITDRRNMAALARVCHDKVTNEDPLFYSLGLVVHSWEVAA